MRKAIRGFTLIELLVVVLIIGILAAIALPRYQVSVYKTQFSNMRTVATSYVRAAKVYKMETGAWPERFDVLSVQEPGGSELYTPTGSTCASNSQMYCCVNVAVSGHQGNSIVCGHPNYLFGYQYEFDSSSERCAAKQGNTIANNMCKSWGAEFFTNANFISPVGHQVGYAYYALK